MFYYLQLQQWLNSVLKALDSNGQFHIGKLFATEELGGQVLVVLA